jgi:hypothetical protein
MEIRSQIELRPMCVMHPLRRSTGMLIVSKLNTEQRRFQLPGLILGVKYVTVNVTYVIFPVGLKRKKEKKSYISYLRTSHHSEFNIDNLSR